jgi:phosphatidylglycerol:prolipoprotein diacylglycerol transferase
MVFPDSDGLRRHPSQIYEAFLEGLVLFFIVRFVSRKTEANGVVACTAAAGYGLFRFIVEFFRQPDAQLGIFFGYFSMGQLLSLPMFLLGSLLAVFLSRKKSAS